MDIHCGAFAPARSVIRKASCEGRGQKKEKAICEASDPEIQFWMQLPNSLIFDRFQQHVAQMRICHM